MPERPARAGSDPVDPPQAIGVGRDGDITAADVEVEHVNALAALTPVQARAIARLNRAFRESHLGNCSAKEALLRVYEKEAQERNRERRGESAPSSPEPDQTDFSDGAGRGSGRGGSVGSF